MAFAIDITRPDDLLRLRIEGHNLRVDRQGDAGPEVVVEDPQQPAFLIVHFPPQTIAERAYFEATIVSGSPTNDQTVTADTPDPPNGKPQPPPTTIEDPGMPGTVPASMSHGSRLVFAVPADARIPFTVAGLLDWSRFDLRVNPIAAIGPQPTAADIAAAPAIARPADTDTALELPYRLIVSPTATVRWTHRLAPFTSRGRTELWHTRLAHQRVDPTSGEASLEELSALSPAPLRAIWSDDYNTPIGLDPNGLDPQLQRAAMTPNDRHQLVVKTSAFHGYEGEATIHLGGGPSGPGGVLTRAGGAAAAFSPIRGGGFDLKFWRPFVPQPFFADQLMLSPLGGWLRSRGTWALARKVRRRLPFEALDLNTLITSIQRPAPIGRLPPGDRQPLPSPGAARLAATAPIGVGVLQPQVDDSGYLDLSEWVHRATQGRDHYVQIVYEGELLPCGHRAALVKITERKFKEKNGLIVAHLFQRNFIVVREPEKAFDDRGLPYTNVRLKTLVTPDIAPPNFVGPRSFWVEVMTSTTTRKRLPFLGVGTDHGGETSGFAMPMLFLSQSAQGAERQQVWDVYNDSKTVQAMIDRRADIPGEKVFFARRDPGLSSDNARLATKTMTFALVNGKPRLLKADVNIPQVQELLGNDAPTTIRLFPGYVDQGFDAATGVFAEVVRDTPNADPFQAVSPATLPVRFTSDKAGGFATPNMDVSTLSRQLGPLAGKAADALTDNFDPASFFPSSTAAQLFGTFDLAKILLGGTLGASAPKLRTQTTTVAGVPVVIATLEWTPEVDSKDFGIAKFDKTPATKFKVNGTIRKPLVPTPPPAAAATSEFRGELNDFVVTLLEVVEVHFKNFAFETKSGKKPDITVELGPGDPLVFKGDLHFVEELRKAVPPDLFGAGPSLDLSPTGIRAGFSFALPPIAVGVFALKDVSLGAALTLPFLDGRPSLDFNVSERPRPFLLSVGIFGGGGFFHLQLDTAGLKIVEAAFEFGVTACVDLGVASGGVHIMAGIYFKLERKEPGTDLAPTLTGYLRMGGHLSVLGLIKLSLEFTLSFTYDGARDKAYGRATLTVQVEIAFFSVSVEITVEKAFGGSSGDPTFGQLFPAASVWDEYAGAFA